MSAHEHRWKPALHLDGCHFYEWRYGCDCGAVRLVWAERDLAGDPYSAVWMSEDDGDARCERCAELMAGAEPQHHNEIREPKRRGAAK